MAADARQMRASVLGKPQSRCREIVETLKFPIAARFLHQSTEKSPDHHFSFPSTKTGPENAVKPQRPRIAKRLLFTKRHSHANRKNATEGGHRAVPRGFIPPGQHDRKREIDGFPRGFFREK